jgi:unsaturated chondroitin disaccharide hydrolase
MTISARQQAVHNALRIIEKNISTFANCYPDDTTQNNVYPFRRARDGFSEGDNIGWTTGFLPGVFWLAYELSGDEIYRQAGEHHVTSFAHRIHNEIDIDTHDLGFLYTLSSVVPWRLTGNTQARDAALKASELLMARYLDKIGVFQAWGKLDDPTMRGNTIIDSLMNMPLLYWAGKMTGEARFKQAAHTHTLNVCKNIIRADNTTFHTFFWDTETGEPLRGVTTQGYADNSCWARGQAWAIYGFTLGYHYTGDALMLDAAQRCADYFLDHLPADHVPYWDMTFNEGSDEERDSSSGAIAVCGLHELIRHLPDTAEYAERKQRYQTALDNILDSLIANYTPTDQPEHASYNTLLLHSVYDKPKSVGVDEGCLWGDYFFMEALIRVLKPDWEFYW